MPADAQIVRRILHSLRIRGARIVEAPDPGSASNPFRLQFELDDHLYGALIHVRNITAQRGAGTTHGRPEGEWHAQMIFDGDRRGAGVRNLLRSHPELPSVLFGFVEVGDNEIPVLAAWDPEYHSEYAYSKSLQVKEPTLAEAAETGFSQHQRTTDEILVAFRVESLPEYLANRGRWHGVVEPVEETETVDGEVTRVEAPPDQEGKRGRRSLSGTRAARDLRFRTFVHEQYEGCATCGLQTESLLEAAHIIPVSNEGSDHFSNGIRLCRNCHALFDAGLLLIHPSYEIELSDEIDNEFPGDAGRLREDLSEELIVPDIPENYRPDPEKLQRVLEERWRQRVT